MSQTTATKHKKSSPAPSATAPRKKSAGGTLVGIFVGLVLGMLIATGVVWYMNKTPVPFMERVKPAPLGGNPNQPPVKLPGKPGDPVPRAAANAPAAAAPAPAAAAPTQTASVNPAAVPETPRPEERQGKPHYLQAGSFTLPEDADKLKASLAMRGLEADVQQVMIQNQTFYRLRLGPYTQTEDANRVRAELARAGIDTFLMPKE